MPVADQSLNLSLNRVSYTEGRVGMPLMGPSTHMDPVVSWWHDERWSSPVDRARYLAAYERNLRKYRNHPSILLWANSGNNFGSNDDQEPGHIGRPLANALWNSETARWRAHHEDGVKVYNAIKRLDPTRPILFHQGGPIGDVYTANTYLNFIPLQEREEWPSAWARTGMPYAAVEFGTPLNGSFFRGRNGLGNAQQSEPLATEYAAIYLGEDAYRHESADYRASIARRFVKDQTYGWTDGSEEREWGFQAIQTLFIRNTWRAWRTWNVSGGMVPWTQAHGYDTRGNVYETLPAWKPGNRGLAMERVRSSEIHPYQEDTMPQRPAGAELQTQSADVLAWIAGEPKHWTEKGHGFSPGQCVVKTAVLINDARTPKAFDLSVTIRVGTRRIGHIERRGSLAVGQRLLVPIPFRATAGEGEGEIALTARVAGRTLSDRFAFRVVGAPAPLKIAACLYDPLGKSGPMLRRLGVATTPWNGKDSSKPLVIGREAMSSGRPPGDLRRYVERGGRLLVLAQRREWLRDFCGFRIAEPLARRAFPLPGSEMDGIDSSDLMDWRGGSTLVPPYPDFRTAKRPTSDQPPTYGWRWGNEGAVSSAAIEKPHTSGWTPLLQTEFDLAYSPLMRLRLGRGRVLLCTLDLEDHFAQDALAQKVAARVVRTALTEPSPVPPSTTVYYGNDAGKEMLQRLGVEFHRTDAFRPGPTLTIVGPDANVGEDALKRHLGAGGRILFLSRKEPVGPVSFAPPQPVDGPIPPPAWPEATGLGVSDLRFRAPSPVRTVKGGAEIGASGLLGRRRMGKGVAIYLQIDPDALDASQRTYLRLTRWRLTRAVCQILTNLGATFKADRTLFTGTPPALLYYPDLRTDFELGDDPYRYFRW
ncbi:hypothetical protein BH11ARM2_BH11ARM2_23250 [soil metagenome]